MKYIEPQEIEPKENPRKNAPLARGFLAYFPLAMSEVARISKIGNDQHNQGQELHWDKTKSTDDLDAGMRHLRDHLMGTTRDTDGALHLGKLAWRAMAALERFLEEHPEERRDE